MSEPQATPAPGVTLTDAPDRGFTPKGACPGCKRPIVIAESCGFGRRYREICAACGFSFGTKERA